MEVQCQNCGVKLSKPVTGSLDKAQCPNCGIMVPIPPTRSHVRDQAEKHAQKKERTSFKRIFEPIPRAAAYAGGALLIFLITSPFWISRAIDIIQRQSPYIIPSVDTPSSSTTNTPTGRDLTLYNDVRLGTRRDIMEHRFGLTLQNTRGMRPEIYVGHNIGDIDMIMGFFYDGLLKEVTLVMRERPATMETIQLELIDLYGEPQTRTREDAKDLRSLTGLRGIVGNDDLNSKLAAFKHRYASLWTDGKVRLDTLIYSNDDDTSAILQVHLAAADWLETNRSALRPVGLQP